MISRIRIVLAWLLLLALPMQGFAAASMLYCGPMSKAPVAAVAEHQHADGHATSHEHAAAGTHGHGHDHAASESGHHSVDKQLPDGEHSCSVCAACGHTVALTETPHIVNLAPVPSAVLSESFTSYPTRPSPVPDKPPRA